MTFPLFAEGMVSGLVLGFLFGFVLENAGFGSARKMAAQFSLRDFSVIKVMMTAVIVAAIGLWLGQMAGLLPAESIFVPTVFFGAVLLGGALVGAGFALGGYCPGTSVCALGSGRIDAILFITGMVLGVFMFAGVFTQIESFYLAGQGPAGQTLDELLGVPTPVVLAAFVAFGLGLFALGAKLEKSRGGPLKAEEAAGEV
jgi:uncharacterized membrane protein YedE/YeeE